MNSLFSEFRDWENPYDLDVVLLANQEEAERYKAFLKKVFPREELRVHPRGFKGYAGLIYADGHEPIFSGRWFEIYLVHLHAQGARIWYCLDEFIAQYDIQEHLKRQRESAKRAMGKYFASQDLTIAQFLDDLYHLFGSIVFHVPHASTKLPPGFKTGPDCGELGYYDKENRATELALTNIKMSDVLLLEIIQNLYYPTVAAEYSRLYVDVEKYWDNEKEEMAKYGMGALYTKDYLGRTLRHSLDPEYMAWAKRYYDAHHKKLRRTIMDQKGDVLLIDLHSFNTAMADVANHGPYPDVCIGFNKDHDELLVELVEGFCEAKGLSHARNFPYKGSMTVPPIKGKKIRSIMIEINKRVYL